MAESVCIPLWNSLRAGRRRQAHGLAGVEETLARDSVSIATANVKAAGRPARGGQPPLVKSPAGVSVLPAVAWTICSPCGPK